MTGAPVTRGGEALSAASAAYVAVIGLALARFPQSSRGDLLVLASLGAGAVLLVGTALGLRSSRAVLLLGAAAMGVLAGGARVALLPAAPHPSAAGVGRSFVGVVRQGPLPGGPDQLVVDVIPGPGDPSTAVLVRLRPGGSTQAAMAGDTVAVSATRVSTLGARSRGRDDGVELTATGATLERTAEGGTVGHLVDRVRAGVCDLVDGQLPAPVGTVLLAVVFGLRRPLPAALSTAFQATGFVHLLVLSGLKVAVLTRCLRRLCDAFSVSRATRLLTVLPAVAGYVVLGGAGPAATRSALMAAVTLLLARDGRRVDALPLLAATAIGVLSHDPRGVLTVGFQLSYAGTAGIILLADPIARRLRGPALARDAVAATLAAQLATLPITASTFGMISLIGPLANAVALPLLPLLVMVGSVGVALAGLDPALGWLPLHAAALGCLGLIRLAQLLGSVPGAAIAVGATGATCLLGIPLLLGGTVARAWAREQNPAARDGDGALRRSGRVVLNRCGLAPAAVAAAAAVVIVPWLLLSRPDGRLHVTVLDAGDGVAVLVRTPSGTTVLVDAGSSAPALGTALGAALPLDAPELDGLVLTGAGRRTVGGLSALLPQHPVGELLLPDVDMGSTTRVALLALTERGSTPRTLPPGGAWRWGDADWRCLPVNPSLDVAPGAACALQVAAPDGAILVLGDLDPGAQDELASTAGTGLRSRLLIVAPGGAVTPALLAAVSPQRVVIPGASRGVALPELAGLRVDRLGGHSRGYVLTASTVEDG